MTFKSALRFALLSFSLSAISSIVTPPALDKDFGSTDSEDYVSVACRQQTKSNDLECSLTFYEVNRMDEKELQTRLAKPAMSVEELKGFWEDFYKRTCSEMKTTKRVPALPASRDLVYQASYKIMGEFCKCTAGMPVNEKYRKCYESWGQSQEKEFLNFCAVTHFNQKLSFKQVSSVWKAEVASRADCDAPVEYTLEEPKAQSAQWVLRTSRKGEIGKRGCNSKRKSLRVRQYQATDFQYSAAKLKCDTISVEDLDLANFLKE